MRKELKAQANIYAQDNNCISKPTEEDDALLSTTLDDLAASTAELPTVQTTAEMLTAELPTVLPTEAAWDADSFEEEKEEEEPRFQPRDGRQLSFFGDRQSKTQPKRSRQLKVESNERNTDSFLFNAAFYDPRRKRQNENDPLTSRSTSTEVVTSEP
ncbi:MAG: hypothetical protein ACK559_41125, partial [bacterium]